VQTAKKVLFIIQDVHMPSSRIRVLNLLPWLDRNGVDCSVVFFPRHMRQRWFLYGKLRHFDIVYLQKRLLSPVDSFLLRRCSRTLIFDFDDAIYFRHDSHPDPISRARYVKFKFLIRRCDYVVAGNRILAAYASQFNRRVTVIPSSVKTENIPLKNHNPRERARVIGWIGTGRNLSHLKLIESALQRLAKRHPFELKVISDRPLFMEGVKVSFVPWRLATQEEEVASLDIGLMPLPSSRYAEGKCAYKALQYMAAQVPPVCSDVGINAEVIQDGKEGFVVKSTGDFYQALEVLITDGKLRKEMGERAREKVRQSYSEEVIGAQLAEFLLSV